MVLLGLPLALAVLGLSSVAAGAAELLDQLLGKGAKVSAEQGSGVGQEPSSAAGSPANADLPPGAGEGIPGAYELVPRAVALEAEATALRSSLGRQRDQHRQEAELAEGRERLQALEEVVERETDAGLDGGRLARLHNRAERHLQQSDELLAATSRRYRYLEELGERWQDTRTLFVSWRDKLRGGPDFASLRGTLLSSLRVIAEVEREVGDRLPAAIAQQNEARQLVRDSRVLLDRIETLYGEWRREVRRRNGPFLFSPHYAAQLQQASRAPGDGVRERLSSLPPDFVEQHWPLFAVQLLLAFALALTVRWLDRLADPATPLHRLLSHPHALGMLIATVVVAPAYEPMPGLWRVVQAGLLAGSLALLAHSTFSDRRERWGVFLLAGGQLAAQGLEAAAPAMPLYRLALLLLLLAPLVALAWLALGEARSAGRLTPLGLGLRLGFGATAVVLLAEVIGFHLLARWLLEAALGTVFLVFAANLGIRLGRRLLRLVLYLPGVEKRPALLAIRDELARRIGRALKVAILVVTGLNLAEVWGLAASPYAAWQAVMGASLQVAGYRINAGRILLAAAALYASLGLSWLVRGLLSERIAGVEGIDRGIADSVKTLLHYSLITVGFFIALSLAGFELSNLAILAGAFGVGIGFGLQNIVNNFVSGLILLFERPVRAGDAVVLAGETGVVQRIGLRSTTIRTVDRSEVIVPNSQLIAEPVTNWTLSNRVVRAVLPVGVAYGSNLKLARETLLAVARQHEGVLADPAPQAVVVGLGASSIDLELRVFLSDIDLKPQVPSELLVEVVAAFAAAGLNIPFPQLDVHLDAPAGGEGTP